MNKILLMVFVFLCLPYAPSIQAEETVQINNDTNHQISVSLKAVHFNNEGETRHQQVNMIIDANKTGAWSYLGHVEDFSVTNTRNQKKSTIHHEKDTKFLPIQVSITDGSSGDLAFDIQQIN